MIRDQETRDAERDEYAEIFLNHKPDERGFCIACFERFRPCDGFSSAQSVVQALDDADALASKIREARDWAIRRKESAEGPDDLPCWYFDDLLAILDET
jgi:hypothetical protein